MPDGVIHLTSNEVLFRQAHPTQMKGTRPTSAVFKPTSQHDYTLSTTRQWVGPKQAYVQHITANLQSSGTWGISVFECAAVDLDAFDDSALAGMPTGHVSIPFGIPEGNPGKKRLERQAKHLKERAIARGCLYAPPPPGATFGVFLPKLPSGF